MRMETLLLVITLYILMVRLQWRLVHLLCINYSSLIHMQVYCNMEGINCDGEGGWTRVTYINMTQSGATCPNGLTKLAYNNIDHPLCGRQASSASCASTTFSSNGLTYSKVCGQVRGYQYGHNDALRDFSYGIDSFYVDGVSITYGNNPRQHIWTYIGGLIEDEGDQNGCPCNTNHDGSRDTNGTFIGTHYYCESGIDHGRSEATILYPDDPLWDGQQCDDAEAPCCPANSKMPWFYRSLDTQTSDDIELRVCSNRETSVENTPLDIIELYIK